MLNEQGFQAAFDFLYLPTSLTSGGAYGYAFVNMVSHETAARAVLALTGFKGWAFGRNEMRVEWSGIQGSDAYVEKYRNSPVMHRKVPEESKPAIFSDGVETAFPPPTRPIKPPRLRDRM